MTLQAVSATQLHDMIERGESILLLDVRNPQDFNDWRIQAKRLDIVNIPYFQFLEEEEQSVAELSKDTEIVIICTKGNSAQVVGKTLAERGYRVSYLEGGMTAWSQFYHPVTVAEDANLKLIQVNRLAKGCLSYLVISQGEALVVDASRHIDEYIRLAAAEGAVIKHIMDTHLHADHISGGFQLAEKSGAKYYISTQEMQGSERKFEALEQRDRISFGSVDVRVMSIPTPGHTPGSVSLLVDEQYLLSGDTIFVGGLGRPDLGGKAREWAQSLYETVFEKIAALSDDVTVLPTHFADIKEINEDGYVGAKLGEIRRSNDVMRTEDREQFTELVAGTVSGATPPNYHDIMNINRGELIVDSEKATELEIGPNRCAIHHG